MVEPDLAEALGDPERHHLCLPPAPGVKWHNKPPVNGRELVAEV